MHKKRSSSIFETLEGRALFTSVVGLQGAYFDNPDFSGKTIALVDPQVNFSWSGTPVSGIGKDTFSVRWTGTITPTLTDKITFYVNNNDGARLWVNHKLLIDHWSSHSTTEDKATITLVANTSYDVQLEFWDNTGTATAQLKWASSFIKKATIPSSVLTPAPQNLLSMLDHDLAFASAQLKRTMSELGNSTSKFVNRTKSDGKWNVVSKDDWTSGFLAGNFWQMFNATGNSYWADKAKLWTLPLAGQATKQTGDLWFQLATSFKPLYERTGDPAYRQVLLDAAASKNTMWNETVGGFQTTWRKSSSGDPRANFGLLMDQTTDMQLMLWAADQTGNQEYRDRALRHIQNVIDHMVRPDGSVYQWAYFDTATGEFISGENYQGLNNQSTWSRGQSWAMYTLADIAKTTASPEILAAAQKVADYYLDNVPADGVPYWDFNDPKIPATYKDTSAAAVAANGLLDLSTLVADPLIAAHYRGSAQLILTSLSSKTYLAEGTANRGLLLHGAQNVPNDSRGNDVSLIFGDYYFLEAINRYRGMTLALIA